MSNLDIGGPGRYRLRYFGDPVLSTTGYSVEFQEQIPEGLITAMADIMRQNRGKGLSAHQVGVPINIALISRGNSTFIAINPVIEHWEPSYVARQEGCLSIPDVWVKKYRSTLVRMVYKDQDMVDHKTELKGLDAQCAQHELDHLAGVLLLDGCPRQLRRQAERIIAKKLR